MKRYWIDLSGTVQGVGFRWFVSRQARRLGLTGHVCNRDDGHVEIEAQGPSEAFDRFLALLKVGNGYSEVTHMDVREIAVRISEHDFEITG